MTRKQAIEFLKKKPHRFGRLLGFTKLTALHCEWIRKMVFGKDDNSIAASRGTYKTTSVSIALAITMILFPRKRIMFMRKTDNDVKEIIKQVAKILKDPHTQYIVQCIYGVNLRLVIESSYEITTNLAIDIKGTSQLVGVGSGASLTGKHFDVIFTDDIINIKDRISQAERNQTKIVYQELQNVKNRDGGRIINTLTVWHKDDASNLMPNLEKYDCYHPLIKDIISDDELQHIRDSMTAPLFACNYELRIIAEENLLFPERPVGASPTNVRETICHIDCAYGGGDYTAFTAMAYHDGNFYIYGKCWQKHIEDCYGDIHADYIRFSLGKCWTETNADKGFVARDLKRKMGMRMVTYHESMNKYVKISTYLKAIWPHVIFVEGTDEQYIEQILDYSAEAEHDDCADSAACLAMRLYKKAGIRLNVDLEEPKEEEV